MSLLATEFSQLIYRVPVLAPKKKQLSSFFEQLIFELSTDLAVGQKTDLKIASLSAGPMLTWASFTLGIRSKYQVRIQLMGFALENELPSPLALELSEGLLMYTPPDEERLEDFLRLKLSPDIKSRPNVVVGLMESLGEGGQNAPASLRVRALREWMGRNFDKTQHLSGKSNKVLQQAVEWVLSF